MEKESSALEKAARSLEEKTFSKALDLLMETKHKVVVTGIGKSGHVGKKIAATLCSTGTPAAFLHPSEAVHGDLGIHQTGDSTLFLSNSGSTPELLFLEPVLRSRGARIVGILGKMNSPLANKVDVALDASVDEEADHLGIVPTASFAVASSLGDAISSALMIRRGFNANEYAKTHPAGQLGRNLILRVSDVFHPLDKIAIVNKRSTLQNAVIEMSKHPLGAACVVEKNHLVGIITDGDLRRALQLDKNIKEISVDEIMSSGPITIFSSASLGEALEVMEKRQPSPISILPVLDEQSSELLGLVRLHDIYGS